MYNIDSTRCEKRNALRDLPHYPSLNLSSFVNRLSAIDILDEHISDPNKMRKLILKQARSAIDEYADAIYTYLTSHFPEK